VKGISKGAKVTRKRKKGQVGIVEEIFWCRWGPNTGRLMAMVKWHGSGVRRGNRSGGDRTTGILVESLTLSPATQLQATAN
jgi:hypothetical protein